jgi:hypothetical protein
MTWTKQGTIRGGAIVLADSLPLPEGAEVIIRIEAQPAPLAPSAAGGNFEDLPFFGMWADRSDLCDSTDWVRRQRAQWQQRMHRSD